MARMRRLRAIVGSAGLTCLGAVAWAGNTETANGPIFEGVELTVDVPRPLVNDPTIPGYDPDKPRGGERVKNFGAPRDNLGLCVFATLDMAARTQNVRQLIGIVHKIPNGGGWPEKVAEVVRTHAPELGLVQYEGTDPAGLDLAMRTGRPCGVTYGYGEFYDGKTIAHMVLLVHLDDRRACIVDNNDALHDTWMSRAEFLRRWKHPNGQGWYWVLLAPPPPPVPKNL